MKFHFVVLLGLLGSFACRAEPVSVGNWFVNLDGAYVEAYTVNESGSVLGMLCGSESCVFYADLQAPCEQDTRYSSLISAPSEARAIALRCMPTKQDNRTRYFLLLEGFDDIERIVEGGGVLGMAVALRSGEFAVSRFDLGDGRRATQLAISQASKVRSKGRAGDQRL